MTQETLESDSEERGFQSFHFRIWALVRELQSASGGKDAAHYVFKETLNRARKKIKPASSPPLTIIEERLRRGWSHLLSLYRDANAPDFYAEINAWTPAKAWYAIHHTFTALIPFVATQAKRLDHDLTTVEAAKLIAQRQLFVHPFDMWVLGAPPDITYPPFGTQPQPISNLMDPRNTSIIDQLGLLLRSTAEDRLELKRRRWLRENPGRKRLSPGKRKEWAGTLGETTIFNFMYRLRLRVNYEDADTFVVGAPSDDKAQWFAQNLVVVTDALMAATEGVLSAYVDHSDILRMVDGYASKRGCDSSDPIGRRKTYIT